jgi:hypothetical protein
LLDSKTLPPSLPPSVLPLAPTFFSLSFTETKTFFWRPALFVHFQRHFDPCWRAGGWTFQSKGFKTSGILVISSLT